MNLLFLPLFRLRQSMEHQGAPGHVLIMGSFGSDLIDHFFDRSIGVALFPRKPPL